MEKTNTTEKTISEQWIQGIFESLRKLENLEIMAKHGCENIIEFGRRFKGEDLDLLKTQNVSFFLTEFEIVLTNSQPLISEKDYEEINNKFLWLKDGEKKTGGFLEKTRHYERVQLKLHSKFYTLVIPTLSELRSKLVKALWKILSPSAKDTLEELPL